MAEFILFTSSSESSVANSRTILWEGGKKNNKHPRWIPKKHCAFRSELKYIRCCRAEAELFISICFYWMIKTVHEVTLKTFSNIPVIKHHLFFTWTIKTKVRAVQVVPRGWAVQMSAAVFPHWNNPFADWPLRHHRVGGKKEHSSSLQLWFLTCMLSEMSSVRATCSTTNGSPGMAAWVKA